MKINSSLQLMLQRAIILIAAAIPALCLTAFAQDKPAPPAASTPAASAPSSPVPPVAPPDLAMFSYDVVSIKPYKQSDAGMSMSMRMNKDGFSSQGFGLLNLMFNAFPIVMSDQIVGLPSWTDNEYYSIDAKMDEQTAAAYDKLPRDQKKLVMYSMMRALLADRFQLKYHKEARDLPVYNLVVAKSGLKIKPTPEGSGRGYSMGGGKITGTGIDLDSLAFSLSNEVGRKVVNQTGLTGGYDMDLKWQPDAMAAGANSASGSETLPDLFTAVQEQLGLKLEPAKGPVDVYVIDHVERPSDN